MDTIAIVGTGLIGRAWTVVFARGGHAVNIWDEDPAAVEQAMRFVADAVAALASAGALDEEAAQVTERVRPCATLEEALASASYVQESTAERLDVKQAVFARMDALATPDAILASSTSTMPASRFSEALPGRH